MARLTPQQKSKLPQELQLVLKRFEHDPRLLNKLKHLLSGAAQKVAQHAINHETFCDYFIIPRAITGELLKLYGMTEKEMQAAMAKIHFVINRMYTSPYYQSLSIAYLIGLNFDDQNIRRLSLLLIAILIWNGRKKKSFPSFCDPDVARYVLDYELQGNHTLKRAGGTAFGFLDSFNVPAVDNVYKDSIANNLDHKSEGLIKLVVAEYNRIKQLFDSMKKAYYRIQKEGKKSVITSKYGQQYGEGDMVEQKESFSGNVERLVDKIEKNSMLNRNVIMRPEGQKALKTRLNISTAAIKKISDWIEAEDNQDEVRYFFELFFTVLKPQNETDICKYDMEVLGKRVSGEKKDPNLLKAKEILNHAVASILGPSYKSLGEQSKSRTRLMVAYSFMTYMKLILCKKV